MLAKTMPEIHGSSCIVYKQESVNKLAENQERVVVIRLQGHQTRNLVSTLFFFKDHIYQYF